MRLERSYEFITSILTVVLLRHLVWYFIWKRHVTCVTL
uniref:Uncharacterized protein n=1 Tax=Brassica oleracea TaxID=3712 RepID=A0A3P6H2K8_BRAOL|nr:unnamed protein product [Brassica oleracea]